MTATDWTLVLIWVGAIASTSFVLLYGLTSRWWISWIGRALLTSSFGLTLLLDLTLFIHYHPLVLSATEGNLIIAIVALGACLKLLALLLDKRATGWRRRPR